MIPFGPQLVGQTEKALAALLRTVLDQHDLSESQWVTLRLTDQFAGDMTLPAFVRDRSQLPDPDALLFDLTVRGLVSDDRLTDLGRSMLGAIGGRVAELTRPVWDSLDAQDTATAGRVLNVVLQQAREILAAQRQEPGTP